LIAFGCALVAGSIALRFSQVWIGAGICVLLGIFAAALALRPMIEVHETHLMVGRQGIGWQEIQRVDRTHWTTPLVVHLTLVGERGLWLVHAGGPESASSLLRHLRRYATQAKLDGIPYPQYWGEPKPAKSEQKRPVAPQALPRYPLLQPEDEAEIERMFQRLKSVGHLDSRADSHSDSRAAGEN
jgi:hypothetical protein